MRKEDRKIEIDNHPVRELLGGLKRVEAPGDFGFRVKARIANGRPADRNTPLFPAWARLTAALVLFLFVGGYFGYRGFYPSAENVTPALQTAGMQQINSAPINDVASQPEITKPSTDQTLAAQMDVKPANTGEKPNIAVPEKLVSRTASSNKNPVDGSFDQSLGVGEPLRPKGLDAHRISPKRKDFDKSSGISAKDLLMQLGVDAGYADSAWKVGGVKQNSMAERSGVRSGDVIQAINDQDLTEKTTLPSPFSGKSIRVRRDGKSIQIDLKP